MPSYRVASLKGIFSMVRRGAGGGDLVVSLGGFGSLVFLCLFLGKSSQRKKIPMQVKNEAMTRPVGEGALLAGVLRWARGGFPGRTRSER